MPIILDDSAAASGTTLLDLYRHVAEELGYASGTCSAAGATGTTIDTSVDSPLATDDDTAWWQNAWVMVEADSAVTPLNVGSIARVASYTAASRRLNHTALPNATTTTQQYGVYFCLPPDRHGAVKGIRGYVNDVLRQLRYRDYALLTLVTDGDMEASGVTNWTAVNSTLAKSTTAGYVSEGAQSLQVLNTLANGYARSDLVSVACGQTYDVVADLTNVVGTAKLQLWDETNGAEIDNATTAELRKGWLYLDSTYIPSGCKQVSVRLGNSSAAGNTYWDNVSLRSRGATSMPLPSWFLKPEWLEEVVYRHGGGREQTNDSYHADERRDSVVYYRKVLVDHVGSTPYRVKLSAPPSFSLLFARCLRPYTELSALTDTTLANKDWVRAWVLHDIFRTLGKDTDAKKWLDRALGFHETSSPKWQGRSFVPHRDI